jgi:hypothetical protein
MQRTTISALFLVLLACAVPAGAVMPGVLQFSQGNAAVQGPIYQVALGSSGGILWAVAPGGILYQINATTMQYMSETVLSPPLCSGSAINLGIPTCLFVDDSHSRVYVCYAPNPGLCTNLFIVNAATLSVLASASYQPAGNVNNLPLTQHYYDAGSRMLASLSYQPSSGSEVGIQLYNVTADSFPLFAARGRRRGDWHRHHHEQRCGDSVR